MACVSLVASWKYGKKILHHRYCGFLDTIWLSVKTEIVHNLIHNVYWGIIVVALLFWRLLNSFTHSDFFWHRGHSFLYVNWKILTCIFNSGSRVKSKMCKGLDSLQVANKLTEAALTFLKFARQLFHFDLIFIKFLCFAWIIVLKIISCSYDNTDPKVRVTAQ